MTKTKSKKTPWYCTPPAYESFGINAEQVLCHLKQRPTAKYRVHLFMNPDFKTAWRAVVSARTIKKMIEAGYRDLEIWSYTTPMVSVPELTATGWRAKWKPHAGPAGMVIDIDSPPGMASAHDVFQKIKDLNLEVPRAIYTTSPGHFHIPFFSGDKNWTLQDKIDWVARWSGIDPSLYWSDIQAFEQACTKHGIDMAHFRGKLSEYRVPGSVNYKRSSKAGHIITTKETIWDNSVGRSAMVDWLLGHLANYPMVIRKDPPAAIDASPSSNLQIPKNEKIYAQILPKMKITTKNTLSSYFYKNIGLLLKNTCRINQIELAKLLKISQPAASRLLRTLVESQVLTLVDASYIQSSQGRRGRSKTYGAGDALKQLLFEEKQQHTVYPAGESFKLSNKDIRKLSAMGYGEEKIIDYILLKYQKKVSRKYIETRVRNWIRKKEKNEYYQRPLGATNKRHNPASERLEYSVDPRGRGPIAESIQESVQYPDF